MLARLSDETVTDLKIAFSALALLGVFRVVVWMWDTRHDFDRPKKHGERRNEMR